MFLGAMMDKFSQKDIEERKKAIFDAMSPRGQRRILKLGYESWDPFQDPKDPIEIRRDSTNRTLSQLVTEYFEQNFKDESSAKYRQGVFEMALGLMNNDDRYQAMYDFACWYAKLKRQ